VVGGVIRSTCVLRSMLGRAKSAHISGCLACVVPEAGVIVAASAFAEASLAVA